MMLTFDNPAEMSPPEARYKHVAILDLGTARMLVLAGQIARGPNGDIVGRDDFAAQARQVFDNVATILGSHGAAVTDIVKTTYYVTNMANRALLSAARDDAFGDHEAASTLVEISALSSPEFLVEIDVLAVVEHGDAALDEVGGPVDL